MQDCSNSNVLTLELLQSSPTWAIDMNLVGDDNRENEKGLQSRPLKGNHSWFSNKVQECDLCDIIISWYPTRIILGMGSSNERPCYNVTWSLIGWAHAQNYPCPKLHKMQQLTLFCSHQYWLKPIPLPWNIKGNQLGDLIYGVFSQQLTRTV